MPGPKSKEDRREITNQKSQAVSCSDCSVWLAQVKNKDMVIHYKI